MLKRLVALAFVGVMAACTSGPTQQPPSGPNSPMAPSGRFGTARYLPGENLYPVGAIPDAVLHDDQRNKDLAMSIEYPTRGGPYPVIIFSHGYGSSKDAYTPLTEYWAGHGYICIKPSHADAGALRQILARMREQRRAERQKESELPRDQRRARQASAPRAEDSLNESLWSAMTPADWTARAGDVSFILDSLDTLEQRYPELAGKIQKNVVGVAGHSLGAFTTMLLSGTVDFKTTPPLRTGDPRVKAAIAMSPQGVGQAQGLTAESWRDIRIPMMFMTGSLDRGTGEDGDPKWRHEAYAYSPAGDKFFVSFAGARHGTFTGGVLGEIDDSEIAYNGAMAGTNDPYGGTQTAAQRRANTRNESPRYRERNIFAQVKIISTAFWDAYLKKDQNGLDYMKTGGTLDLLAGPDVVVERK